MDASEKLSRLTTAVWVLVAISALNLLATLYGLWPYVTYEAGGSVATAPTPQVRDPVDKYANFYEWPLEKQLEAASVIALGEHRVENDQVKTFIVEVLKHTPGTAFYYKIGDEWGHGQPIKANTSYGDGQVMFFVGSPAQFRFSTSHHGGRITGLGDMPLDLFRKQVQAQK